jgi:ComF family protein
MCLYYIMMRFLDFLFPPRSDELVLRELSADAFLAKMNPVLVGGTHPETIALFSFGHTGVRAAIHEAKYHGSERAFELLGSALAEYLREGEDTRLSAARVVPVPLSGAREKERGFNQVHEVVLRALRSLGAAAELEVDAALLERTRDTASQVSLPRRAREENMRGAFRAAHAADPRYTYIVIDDVITTGATLQAAVDALKDAGAEYIITLALAH